MTEIRTAQCLVCQATAIALKSCSRWTIYKCGGCGLEFCHPMPEQEEFDKFYRDYRDPRASKSVVRANAERNIRSLAEFGLSGEARLLDFGSGEGAFCRVGESENWVNYDPYQPGYGDPGLLTGQRYDWITLWGVLEHLPDPVGTLKSLSDLLKPEGNIGLTTVSVESDIPYQHKPPEHVTYWTRKAMEEATEKAGLSICEYRPYVMVQLSEVYLDAVLRTVPAALRSAIGHRLPEIIEVPTNEVFVVAKKDR